MPDDNAKPPSKPPTPIGRQSSHSPAQIADAQRVMDDVVREHISQDNPLPADHEKQTADTPTPDRRDVDALPRRLADLARADVPARWLGLLVMFLLGAAGSLVAVGVVWGQTVSENRTGVAEAKADAAEAKKAAVPVGELKGKLDLNIKKTDETATKLDKVASDTAAIKTDVAVMQEQQKSDRLKLNDMAADLKTLVKAAKK